MIFQPGQFIKHKFSEHELVQMGLGWLFENPQPIEVVSSEERPPSSPRRVLYHFKNPLLSNDTWGIWGQYEDFYQNNECKLRERT